MATGLCLITARNYNGEEFVYDEIGNPTTYRGRSAVWSYGRLSSMDGNTFSYDVLGRRASKNDIAFTYDGNGNLIRQSNGLSFLYDHTGVFAVKYNNATYFYRKNAQNDIIALLDTDGNVVVQYKYDAWGNHKVLDANGTEIADAGHIGYRNPFRYRSYYYDTETGLYFLKTRYYDPETGRFLSPDSVEYLDPETIGGLNLYAYCNNNPVMFSDPEGHMPKWLAWTLSGLAITAGLILSATGIGGIAGGILIGAGAGALINGYVTEAAGGDFFAGYVGGAISGALCAVGAGLAGVAFNSATALSGAAVIGKLAAGATYAFVGGFVGNTAGVLYTELHSSGWQSTDLSWGEVALQSLAVGTLNVLAGVGSGMSTVLANAPKQAIELGISYGSNYALRLSAGLVAGGTEAMFDLSTWLISRFM